jgi:hypothetical protein
VQGIHLVLNISQSILRNAHLQRRAPFTQEFLKVLPSGLKVIPLHRFITQANFFSHNSSRMNVHPLPLYIIQPGLA